MKFLTMKEITIMIRKIEIEKIESIEKIEIDGMIPGDMILHREPDLQEEDLPGREHQVQCALFM